MNKELKRKIKRKNKMWLINKRYNWAVEGTKQEYNKLKREVTKDIKSAVKNYEKDLVKNSKSNPKLLYAYINKKQNVKNHIKALENHNGEVIFDTYNIADVLNNYFKSVYVNEEINTTPTLPLRTNYQMEDIQIDYEDVKCYLSKLDVRKSTGFDNVHPYVLNKSNEGIAVPLTIFKMSLSKCEVPQKWKCANVTPLFKKGSRLAPENYRPVSLTSIPCKVLERIISDKLSNYLNENNLLSSKQHGFVKKKNCTTNLLESIDMITNHLSKGEPVDVLYTDFQKAFDTVPHQRLLQKLKSYGIGEKLMKWMESYLRTRKQRVVMGDVVSKWIDVVSGVPQGSVLGPLLFLIYINDLPEVISNVSKLYADDNKIMAVVNNTEDRDNFQNDINSLNEWCNEWLIKLNLDKCKIMHIGKNNNQYEYNTMNGKLNQILKTTTLERDIGVNISNDLKWEHHIKLIVNKANSKLGLLAKTFRYKNKQLIKSLYCTFVRPLLEFAVPVWCPYLEKDISKLEKVQHRATKLAPEIRHLPYNERLKKLGLTTLVDRRTRGDLIQQYKIYHEFDNINWYSRQDYA